MNNPFPLLQIKSHLNTVNVYVKRSIVKDNIQNIEYLFRNKDVQVMPASVFKQLIAEKKKQKQILATIENQIFDIEQGAFQFGAP